MVRIHSPFDHNLCICVPRLTYLLRTCPAFRAASELCRIDDKFVEAFEDILKISLSGHAFIQLSLPTSSGGMGITTPSGVALGACAAPCYAAMDGAREILGEGFTTSHLLDTASGQVGHNEFASKFGSAPPSEDREKQSKWTEVASESVLSALCARLSHSEVGTIGLSHVSLPDSGWWLQALPCRDIGTLMTDRDFMLAAGSTQLPILPPVDWPVTQR